MYDFDVTAGSKAELYRDLLGAMDAVTAGEADGIANMANGCERMKKPRILPRWRTGYHWVM